VMAFFKPADGDQAPPKKNPGALPPQGR